MMAKRRTEITIETHQVTVLRRRAPDGDHCKTCGRPVPPPSPDDDANTVIPPTTWTDPDQLKTENEI